MFRLKSWVISSVVLMLVISVTLSVTTDFHVINQAISILTLIITVVLLQQQNLRFGDLLSFNALLLIHVIAAYISDTTTMVIMTVFVTFYMLVGWFKKRPWLDWLFVLGLTVWWLLLGMNHYWLFASLVFSINLLKIQVTVNESIHTLD